MIKPYFETELGKLYHGDCLEVMKAIPDERIDSVITSPPYDDFRVYKGYSFDFKVSAKELFRIMKQGGVVVWVVGDETVDGNETGTSFRQALFFKKIGFKLHDTMIWKKTKMPQNHNRYEQGFEYMFVFAKNKLKTFNGLRDKCNTTFGCTAHISYRDKDGIVKKTSSFNKTKIAQYGLRTNIWDINPCLSSEDRKGHPAPCPIKLINNHILTWSNENDLICDPFLGSGTTAIACERLNRRWIGIEISQEYCDVAINRLRIEGKTKKEYIDKSLCVIKGELFK